MTSEDLVECYSDSAPFFFLKDQWLLVIRPVVTEAREVQSPESDSDRFITKGSVVTGHQASGQVVNWRNAARTDQLSSFCLPCVPHYYEISPPVSLITRYRVIYLFSCANHPTPR